MKYKNKRTIRPGVTRTTTATAQCRECIDALTILEWEESEDFEIPEDVLQEAHNHLGTHKEERK